MLISDSELNPCRLFFRCKWRTCNFFEWWRLEDDNEEFEDNVDGVSSTLNRTEIEHSSTNFVRQEQQFDIDKVDELAVGVVGLRRSVKMLIVVVVLLVIIVVFK